MKTQLQLTVLIVYFGLVFVHQHDGNGNQLWKKTLQTEVTESQNVFNNMKDELQRAQNTNIRKRKTSSNGKWVKKRETNQPAPKVEEDSEEVVTEPEKRYAYFKGDRLPDDIQYGSPDEMYRETLKHVLKLFMTEKCHISEVRYQDKKLKTTLMDEKINKSMDRANDLMGECADDILDTLRDNITSSERIEPITPEIFAELASIFKEVRRYFEERIPSGDATKPMIKIREQVRLADERLHEGYGILKEMVKNTTVPWSR